MEGRLPEANFSEEVKDQNSKLKTLTEMMCTVQTNPQQQEWEERVRIMTTKLTNEELSRSLLDSKLDAKNKETDNLKAALKKANKQLKINQNKYQEDMFSLFEENKTLNNTLQRMEQDSKENARLMVQGEVDKCRDFYEGLFEDQMKHLNALQGALMKSNKQSERSRFHWQGEKSCLLQEKEALSNTLQKMEKEGKMNTSLINMMNQCIVSYENLLDEKNDDLNNLKGALKEAEKREESNLDHWEEDRLSLLQETETLNKTLQKIELDLKEKEMVIVSQLADIDNSSSLLEKQKNELNTLKADLKEAEKQLQSSQIHWKEENVSHLQETETLNKTLQKMEQDLNDKEQMLKCQKVDADECVCMLESLLEKQDKELHSLFADLMESEKQLKNSQIRSHVENTSLLQEKEGLNKTLQKIKQDLKEKEMMIMSKQANLDTCRSFFEGLLEAQNKEKNTLMADLKEADKQLKSSQIHWQEENTSLLQEKEALNKTLQKMKQDLKEKEMIIMSKQANMDNSRTFLEGLFEAQNKEKNTLMADLKEADKQLKSSQIHWQEENTSLLQEKEALNKTLQKMKQDLKEKEIMIMSKQANMDKCRSFLEAVFEEKN